jgi:hypothetical protein
MGIDGADSFDRRSLSSLHSQYSMPRVRSVAAMAALSGGAVSGAARPQTAEDGDAASPQKATSIDSD